ncbi:MAG: DUF1343 domain-containing protein [Bacteroidetes bacterium]|nr:DUF1343 domain-containing protein [Bacteroidota bacterium]
MRKGQFNFFPKSTVLGLCLFLFHGAIYSQNVTKKTAEVKPGAWQTKQYFPILKGKKIGIVANQTSTIGKIHLVDSLQHAGMQILRVFGPEHGFRGTAANGEKVSDSLDKKTGLPVTSLYGKKRKPLPSDLKGIDLMIFDLQDVGVRFYTHLTTLHYIMQACAENHVTLLVLDRPNPNGYYVDGPILEEKYISDVGVHPIPLVHGMTLGELSRMINGKGWLKTADTCRLTVIKVQNWNHNTKYELPISPSPNLASDAAIIAYPTLGLFEGIDISVGRGTPHPFECFGAPWVKSGKYKFVPREIPGKTMKPPYLGDSCKGFYIADFAGNYLQDYRKIYLEWFYLLMKEYPDKNKFFNPYFDKLAGTASLRTQLAEGRSEETIRLGWQPGIDEFIQMRRKFLLYSCDESEGITIY